MFAILNAGEQGPLGGKLPPVDWFPVTRLLRQVETRSQFNLALA